MFRRTRVELLSVAILPLGLGLALSEAPVEGARDAFHASASVEGPVSYTQQVAPIFETKCSECHGTDSPEAELSLLTYAGLMKGSEYGTVVEAGDPDASLLIEMVVAGEMPQDAPPLPAEEIAIIRSWIAQGAQEN